MWRCSCCLGSPPVEPMGQGWGQGLVSREKEARASGENGGQSSKGGLVAWGRLRILAAGQTQPRMGTSLRPVCLWTRVGLKDHRAKMHLLCVCPPPPLGRSEETEQETHRRDLSYTTGPPQTSSRHFPAATFPKSHLPLWGSPLTSINRVLLILQNPTRSHTSSRLVSEIP